MNPIFYEIEHGTISNHFLFEKNTDHAFPLHMHRCYEMVLMLEGEMTIQIDQDTYDLSAGDLILIKPNRLHSYETPTGKSGVCLLCMFSSDLIAAITDPLSKYRLHTVHLHNVQAIYRDTFLLMQEHRDLPTVKGFLYLLCGLFYRQIDYSAEDTIIEVSDLLQKIFAHIESNVDKPCTLHELAQALKYNESYLSRFFYSKIGVSYSDYVRSIKINYACYLLKNTHDSIFNIARLCGYATPSAFNRSFKQITGMNPNEYRSFGGAFDP
ncbi:MAG: helix-turn-helix domain-containing protein [Clostridia bacterium]|nr:helix-turn-helix domain-containing protein [Clostridia bacterium]